MSILNMCLHDISIAIVGKRIIFLNGQRRHMGSGSVCNKDGVFSLAYPHRYDRRSHLTDARYRMCKGCAEHPTAIRTP